MLTCVTPHISAFSMYEENMDVNQYLLYISHTIIDSCLCF